MATRNLKTVLTPIANRRSSLSIVGNHDGRGNCETTPGDSVQAAARSAKPNVNANTYLRKLSDPELAGRAVAGDEAAWREIMLRYDQPLREAMLDASMGAALTAADLDDLMGDFWLSLVEDDKRRLRRFNPARGAALQSWLTIQLVQLLRREEVWQAEQPETVSLDDARHVPATVENVFLNLGLDSGPTSDNNGRQLAEPKGRRPHGADPAETLRAVQAIVSASFSDSSRATDGGSSEEEPMYQKIYGPYLKEGKFKVHAYLLDGKKQYLTFNTEDDANAFIKANERRTIANPITTGEAIKEYVASRTDLKQSSCTTLRFRLETLIQGTPRRTFKCSRRRWPGRSWWPTMPSIRSTGTGRRPRDSSAGASRPAI